MKGARMAVDLNKEPATLADVINLMTMLTIEIMDRSTVFTTNDALTDIASYFLTAGREQPDERLGAILTGFGSQLTATEVP